MFIVISPFWGQGRTFVGGLQAAAWSNLRWGIIMKEILFVKGRGAMP
jgi:hypothetical protein